MEADMVQLLCWWLVAAALLVALFAWVRRRARRREEEATPLQRYLREARESREAELDDSQRWRRGRP